jgi:hypothetical protein
MNQLLPGDVVQILDNAYIPQAWHGCLGYVVQADQNAAVTVRSYFPYLTTNPQDSYCGTEEIILPSIALHYIGKPLITPI